MIRAITGLRPGRPPIFQEMHEMKEVDKKERPEVSGGSSPFVTDPPTYPDPDYPQTPVTDPLGESDLPVGWR